MPDRVPERMSEYMPERYIRIDADRMSEHLPERMSDRMSEYMYINRYIYISRSRYRYMPYIYIYISRWYVINYVRMVCQGEDHWKRDEHNLSCRQMNHKITHNNNIYIFIFIYIYIITVYLLYNILYVL